MRGLAILVIAIFCFECVQSAYAVDLDKKMTVRIHNRKSTKVIKAILGDVNFSYDAKTLRKRKVSINSDSLTARQLLCHLFEDSSLVVDQLDGFIVIYKSVPYSASAKECVKNRILQGKIYDKLTKEPVPYAPIRYAKGKTTVSNADGVFNFPVSCQLDTVSISVHALGYASKQTLLHVDNQNIVALEPETTTLREVVIRKVSPIIAVKKSLKQVTDSYTAYRTMNRAYFREMIFENEEISAFVEAEFDVAKSAYGRDMKEKVQLIKGRKWTSPNYSDSIVYKTRGSLSSCLALDIVHHQGMFYHDDCFTDYDFKYGDFVVWGDLMVHQIDFYPKKASDKFYKGSLYLDQKDYSVRAIKFEITPSRLHWANEQFIIKKSKNLDIETESANYLVVYAPKDGKLHLNYAQLNVSFKVKDKTTKDVIRYRSRADLVFNESSPSEKRISSSQSFFTNNILLDQPIQYSLNYWEDTNFIPVEFEFYEAMVGE